MNVMSKLTHTGRSAILCAITALVLAGCASSPPVQYFSLSPTVTEGGPDAEDRVVLGLGPLRLPEYLNRSQVVVRGVGAELEIREFSRWAEPLSDAVLRVVSSDVDNALSDVVVLVFPWEAILRQRVDFRLGGDVIRFESDLSGRVVLEVQWGVSDIDFQPVVPVRRSRYEVMAGSGDDAAQIASAMNEALGMFSREIVTELEGLLNGR